MKSQWTTRELVGDGVTPDELTRRVRDGALVRVRRGVYASPGRLSVQEAHLRLVGAALAALGPDAVASHASAAVLHGLPVEASLLKTAWVTRTGGSHGRTTAALRQTRAGLLLEDVTLVDGLPCTVPLRSVSDLTLTTSLDWAVAGWDALLHTTRATPEEVAAACGRLGQRRGAANARASAALADGRAESVLESLSRMQIRRLGLPTPELQYPIMLNGVVVARSDFAWPEYRLVGEADGLEKYADQRFDARTGVEVLRDQQQREEQIREAGWWMCRWDWAVLHQPRTLDRRIRAGLTHGAELARACRTNSLGEGEEPRPRAS